MATTESPSGLRRAVTESVGGLPRAFWWLWLSTLVNRLGGFVATFLALYLTAERGYSASYAGLVGALYGLGGIVSSIGAGVLTDRLGRRPTMLVAQVATALSIAALGLMTHPVAIAGVAALVGMASNGSRPAVQAMMADIVRAEDRVRAFGLNYWAVNLGFAISSASAGLIAQYSYHLLFFIEAAMVLACAIVVFVKLPESRPVRAAPSEGSERDGHARDAAEPEVTMWTVLRDGRFMTVVALSLVMATLIQQAFVALPITMGEQGFSSADFGTAIALNGVLIVLLQLPVTRLIQHRDPRHVLVVSALLTGYGFGLNAFAGSVGFFALAILVWTLGEITNTPTQLGLVVRFSPTHGRGRYQGMYILSWASASLAAPLTGGYVIDHFGSDTLWYASAAVGTLAALGYWLLLRDVPAEDVPAEPATESDPGPGPAPVPDPLAKVVTDRREPDEPTLPRTDSVT